jgi:hypothetical protein
MLEDLTPNVFTVSAPKTGPFRNSKFKDASFHAWYGLVLTMRESGIFVHDGEVRLIEANAGWL